MEETAGVLLDFFIIFVLAKAAAEVFQRIRQPVVIGELLVGVAIGPHALGLIDVPLLDTHEGVAMVYEVMAQLGLVVALFLGTALVATSVGITARVLRDLGVLASREARIILGAAVADDILALLALTAVVQIGKEGGVDARELIFTALF